MEEGGSRMVMHAKKAQKFKRCFHVFFIIVANQ